MLNWMLDALLIAFDSKAINNWYSILTQAELRGKVEALVLMAISHYGPAPELIAAYQAYMTSIGKSAQVIDMSQPITPPAKSNEGKYNITINDPQGLVIGGNAQVTQNFGTQVNTDGGMYVTGDMESHLLQSEARRVGTIHLSWQDNP